MGFATLNPSYVLDHYAVKRAATLAGVFLAVAGASAGMAQGLSVDWKLYGGISVQGNKEFCFYDAQGIAVQKPDGHIRVWTKCLPQKDMDAIDINKDFGGSILERTAERVSHYYVPPIAQMQSVDADQSMAIIQYEETADIANIQPRAQIFYELNCPGRILRELSIYIKANGKIGSRDTPSEWKHVAPEGNAANLLRLLCPSQ